jgi:predicted TIM-barrel fold metal-dependent hydrolase
MLFKVKEIDKRFYTEYLADFLPPQIIDIHTHVWLKTFPWKASLATRGARWPARVAEDNSIRDLLHTFELMFPQQKVIPLIFGSPHCVPGPTNSYVSQVARQHNLPGLLVCTPEWSAKELERQVTDGGFLGLKPYLGQAPTHLAADDITIFDFLPHHHLQVADTHGWIVMLHVPRGKRLGDPVNLAQVLEIERRYPNVRLIIAHIGRAYCIEDVGDAFSVLRDSERMLFDFSANTNAQVMEGLIRTVGPKRVLFGSDMPILRMRMRRICEKGVYINLVPPGLYGDVSDDPHMREVSREEGQKLSFFMYEELLAFRRAAEATGLGTTDLKDIFYSNAARLIVDTGERLDVPTHLTLHAPSVE